MATSVSTMEPALTVSLGERSYPIYIGDGLLQSRELLTQYIDPETTVIVTDNKVGPLYLDNFLKLPGFASVPHLILSCGEENKNFATLGTIFDYLLENHLGRNTMLVAMGGGVVGDLTGFAAACYQRGISFLQLPTTLLAQVDSSVGGKTGINHPLGKNMIGAFHQPVAVIADVATLSTLDQRQLSAGLAEIIKYGLIADLDFFMWLESNVGKLLELDRESLVTAITRSCEIKSEIVSQDEKEKDQRALLNLGHTFGHAIEATLGYGKWLHGEAVAAGMAMAAAMAVRMAWLSAAEYRRICRLLTRAGLPHKPPAEATPAQIARFMARDKKVRGGKLRLVLPKGIGNAVVTSEFEQEALRMTLEGKPLK